MLGSQTPIDIHCSKLVDWLVQRRHCKKDWGENLASIRKKIRAAIKDMPENAEIKDLLIGSKLDYDKSRRIIEILRTTEASSKNIFGYYSSQRMKDWQDIVYCYEKDCIYLAEIATDLIRENSYEVPGIRRVIHRLIREKDETEKEHAIMMSRAQKFSSEYQKLAQSYGIKGVNIPQELAEKYKTLPEVMEELVKLSRTLEPELDYYREIAESTSRLTANNFLQMLHYIIKKGNTSVYEWKHGEIPEKIVFEEKTTSSTGASNPSEIELLDDEIDFGEDLPSSESSSGFVHLGNQTDYGNSNIEKTFINEGYNAPQIGCDSFEKIARGDDAKLTLEFRKSRLQFVNNLHELEAFFVQLSFDLTTGADQTNTFLIESNSRARVYDTRQVDQVLVKIRDILRIMNKDKNKILFQMNDSASFVENLTEKFSAKQKQVNDCTLRANILNDKIYELDIQRQETEKHLAKSLTRARDLQIQVECALRDLYGGRPINIMGCVG